MRGDSTSPWLPEVLYISLLSQWLHVDWKGNIPRESGTLEESLQEELTIEVSGGRVEGSTGDGRVDKIGSSDGVRSQESNDFRRAEAGIGEASQDLGNVIYRNGSARNYVDLKQVL